jgi:DNA-3-methyladenine glycosylase II
MTDTMLHTAMGVLHPKAPFDFSKSLDFMARFAPPGKPQAARPGPLAKAVFVNGQTIAFQVESVGTIEEPLLNYKLFSDRHIDEAARDAALGRINLYLSLDDDLRPFYDIGLQDAHFAPVIERLYGYHQVKFLSPFEAGCWAILTQRTALPDARKMKAHLTKRYGSSIEVEGAKRWAFPEPEQMLTVNPGEIEPIVSSKQKAEYISALAHAFADVSLEFLLSAPYGEVEARLRSIKGVGEWSATFILLRGLGRPDRAPLSEWRLAEAASRVYNNGKRMSADAIQQIAQQYGAWQGYWAHYLRASNF